MARSTPPESEPPPLTAGQRKQIIENSTVVIDSLSDIAVEIVTDFVRNSDCAKANTIMLRQPEVLAVKALEQASRNLLQARDKAAQTALH